MTVAIVLLMTRDLYSGPAAMGPSRLEAYPTEFQYERFKLPEDSGKDVSTALKPRAMKQPGCGLPLECAWSSDGNDFQGTATSRIWKDLLQRSMNQSIDDLRQTINALYEQNGLAAYGLPKLDIPKKIHVIPMGGEPYFRRSLRDADMVLDGMSVASVFPEAGEAWLDFGGSHGRVTRILASAFPRTEWHCSDPISDSIEKGRQAVNSVKFVVSPQEPPFSHYSGETFSGIYAISIWSHYNEEAALSWFHEMHRILKHGGVLWISTHGFQAINFGSLDGAVQRPLRVEMLEALYLKGHFYFPMFGIRGDWGLRDGADGSKWGFGAFTAEWVAARLLNVKGRPWSLVYFGPGRSERHQDVYVLRKN